MDRLGRRRELDQLDDLVLEDHLAGRRGDVHADLELLIVGLADGQLAAAPGEVGGEVLHAPGEALALAGHGLPQGFRI